MHRLILASSSPRRREILKQIGILPDLIIAADVDETPLKKELPAKYCLRLAIEKAKKIAFIHPNDIVIAADSTVALGRRIIGKPKDEEEAINIFQLLSGRRHRVISGICIMQGKKIRSKIVTTMVQFQLLNNSDIKLLLSSNEWQDKCGGYAISGKASAFIKQIRGTHSNVMGLPIHETYKLLKAFDWK